MVTCPSCSSNVASTAFCQQCGIRLPEQSVNTSPSSNKFPTMSTCPRCSGAIHTGAAFCNHCGSSLYVPLSTPVATRANIAAFQPATRFCPACQTQVPTGNAFCNNCGQNLQVASAGQGSYPQQSPQYGQMNYQQPMVLRCPICMAMAPLGSTNCLGCRTNLGGVAPIPANMPVQGQQGGLGGIGGLMQGNGGNMLAGALGGAAAVIGGEILLHQVENTIEGNRGYGYHHRSEGLLGGLGEVADDIGLM